MTRIALTLVLLSFSVSSFADDKLTAEQAFERVKSLAGEWKGETNSETPGHISYALAAAGTTVLEREFPGSDHEMMSTYFVDGDRLVRKHYCIMGNQPEMELDLAKSTADNLVFKFIGGTNLNARVDGHVHDGHIQFKPDGGIEAVWSFHEKGQKAGENAFFLKKAE